MYLKASQLDKPNGPKNVKRDYPKADFKADVKDLRGRLDYLVTRLEKEGL